MLSKGSRKQEKSTGIILDSEAKFLKVKIARAIMGCFCTAFVAIIFLPIIWMLLSAFKDTKEFLQIPPTIFPSKVELSKMADIWSRSGLGKSYINTFIVTIGRMVIELGVCGLAGYVLSRLKPKGSSLVQTIVFWSILLPTNMAMVPLYISFVKAGLLNNYLPLWLMAGTNAFHTMLFKSFFDGISMNYLEAARLDGAGELMIFRKIILPLSKPIFMTVSIFSFNGSWGSFLWPYLLLQERSMQPLGVRTFILKPEMAPDEYLMMLIFVIIPPMIVFILLQKYIMEGVNVGGIKG